MRKGGFTMAGSEAKALRNKLNMAPYLFILPALAFITIFIAYPLIENIRLSLFDWSAIDPVKKFVGLKNYVELFGDPIFWKSILNNFYYLIVSTIVQVIFGLVLAVIVESRIQFAKTFRAIFIIPLVISLVAVGLLWTFIYNPIYGPLNQLLSAVGLGGWAHGWLGETKTAIWAVIAVSCWQYSSFCMLLFVAGLQALPDDVYESAKIDGANGWQSFCHITVPLLREVIIVTCIITMIGSFKVFDIVYVMTGGGPSHASEVATTYMYLMGFSNDRMGYASSIATTLIGITLMWTILQLKLFKSGADAN